MATDQPDVGHPPKSKIGALISWLDEQIDRLNNGEDPAPAEEAP